MDRASMISVLEDIKRSSNKCLQFLTEEDVSYYTFKERSEALDMAISALREQEQSKWISVKERLPVGEGRVLCISLSGVYRTLEWNSTFKCWFDLHGHSFKKGIVTHWMPLPEPPKEGAEE